jgi:hypothetical protein
MLAQIAALDNPDGLPANAWLRGLSNANLFRKSRIKAAKIGRENP